MWIPEQYRVKDDKTIQDFITEVGLATLVTRNDGFPIATHTPIELERDEDGNRVLRGHIAKANPQSRILENGANALVIFQSPIHHYISSSWYEKSITPPTWNYMSVHLYGKVSVLNDKDLWESVERLTRRHEKISKCPVSLHTLPRNTQSMLKGVTGFEILVEKVEAAFKLSQNRSKKDFESIISELSILDTPFAKLMLQTLKQIKPQ